MHKQPLGLNRRGFIRLLAITVAVVLVFYAIGLYLNHMGLQTLHGNMEALSERECSYIASQINLEVGNLITQCQELAADKELLRYVIAYPRLSAYQRIASISGLSDKLLRMKRSCDLLENAKILLPQIDRVISTEKSIYDTMDRSEYATFRQLVDGKLLRIAEHGGNLYVLCNPVTRGEPMFLISVCISPERLERRMRLLASENALDMTLYTPEGTVFFSAGTKNGLLSAGKEGSSLLGVQGESAFSAEAEIPLLHLTLRCVGTIADELQPLMRHRMWVCLLTALALVLLVIYLTYFRRYILQPLDTIADSLRQAGETGHFHIDRSDAGFDDLYAQFNSMMENLESLKAQVYEERLRAQQAEIRQLQMQINPHFFYNTLFMVYRMAQQDGNEDIARLSLNLSRYYRYITTIPEHDVPLRDEVNHIRQYLEIQGMRFSPRVRVHMNELPEEIAQENIPPLILQPVVENAFVHGVKNKQSGGVVEVSFIMEQDRFGVTVYDNGGTMDAENVRRLDERMRAGELAEGSALYNLYRRMELLYGDHYELKLESFADGLSVTILFPRTGR